MDSKQFLKERNEEERGGTRRNEEERELRGDFMKPQLYRQSDFGIAKMVEGTTGQANSTVGTPSYLSPEICKNNPYGMKADVWSLGVVLYEMSCLKVPFQASNLPAMALQICTMDFKPLPEDFSSDLHALVNQLLQKASLSDGGSDDLMANNRRNAEASEDPLRRPAMAAVVEEPFVKVRAAGAGGHCRQVQRFGDLCGFADFDHTDFFAGKIDSVG
eukprot:Skav228168  [mRNA]  locus=scaffold439:494073:498021:+ [translate_table: standard]